MNFDYKMVLQVAEKLKQEKKIVFQMIGQGSQKDDFVHAAQEKSLIISCSFPLSRRKWCRMYIAHVQFA